MDPDSTAFHRRFYDGLVWQTLSWCGHTVLKCPFDLWIYQEIIAELRPGLIVETGTYEGGSAMFMAHVCDMLGEGKVISIDPRPRATPDHPRIEYLKASSLDVGALRRVADVASSVAPAHVLVILDANHSYSHVLHEVTAYAPFVTLGSYLIVEDTNINGRPVAVGFGPGPGEAADEFMSVRKDFVRDAHRERLLLSFNPGGYLKRIAPQ